ncbi:MAG: hypothetical protein ACOYMD_14975, partial [Paludibacter sp.]
RIFFNNSEHSLSCEPLSSYLYDNKIEKLFKVINTACYRGYYATWKIENNKIYLLNIESPLTLMKGKFEKEKPISAMEKLFPGQTEVFAYWVNGKLKIQSGELIEYVHMGYESVYDTDIFLKFENGVLIDEKIVKNSPI